MQRRSSWPKLQTAMIRKRIDEAEKRVWFLFEVERRGDTAV